MILPSLTRGIGQRRVGEVDEHTLVVARRRDPNQRPDRLDVASRLADEPADVPVRKLHLDGDGAATPLECFHQHFLRLLRERARYVLHHRAVVHCRPRRAGRTLTPETAVETAPPLVTPDRWSTSLCVAQESPPASTGSARLRSAERPAGASARLCRRRSSPLPGPSSDRSTQGAR